jgi:hypothetical protein
MADDSKQVAPVAKRKPPAAGMGRRKGSVNKITKTIREAVELSFVKVGGADYLVEMAEKQPVAYMALLGKVLPQQIEHSGANGGAIQLEQVKNDAAAFTSAVAGLSTRSGMASQT